MSNTLSIDIGGSNTRVMFFNGKGDKSIAKRWKTLEDPHKNFQKIVDFAKENKIPIKRIGISAPGPANYVNGVFEQLPNLPWNGFEFFSFLRDKLDVKIIKADNDANLMALANHKKENLNESDISLFFTISTGIGAGIIINNRIFRGFNGHAAEVQYAPTAWTNSPNNKDSKPGGVEAFASGSGLAWIGKKENIANTTMELFEKYNSSETAKKIIDTGIESLANLLATSIALINPNHLFFDGSVARHNKWYVDEAVKKAMDRLPLEHSKEIKVLHSSLGDDSALIGAYYLVNNESSE